MAFTVEYQPDPRTLGAYAWESGAAPARRENIQRSIENAQQAAQFNAQMAQRNRENAASMWDRQQERNAQAQSDFMQQQGYALKNATDLQQAELAAQTDLAQEEMRQQGMRARSYDVMVQRGLKDGSLYYSPQQKQQLAEFQRNINSIQADTSIAPEQQAQMVDMQLRRMRAVVPMVRSEDERPVPMHQRVAEDMTVLTADGRVVPIGQLGRGPKDGDVLISSTTRNGSLSHQAKPFSSKTANDPFADFQHPVKLNAIRATIARDIQSEIDTEYANKMAEWEDAKVRFESGREDDLKYTEPRPRKRRPTPAEIEMRLYEMSGGVAGTSPSAAVSGSDAAFYAANSAGQPAGRLTPGAPFANDPGRAPPVVVASEAEALTKPIGTVIILNGRKFVVGE